MNKLDFNKVKSFSLLKKLYLWKVYENKRQTERKYLQKMYFNKELIAKIHKELSY